MARAHRRVSGRAIVVHGRWLASAGRDELVMDGAPSGDDDASRIGAPPAARSFDTGGGIQEAPHRRRSQRDPRSVATVIVTAPIQGDAGLPGSPRGFALDDGAIVIETLGRTGSRTLTGVLDASDDPIGAAVTGGRPPRCGAA